MRRALGRLLLAACVIAVSPLAVHAEAITSFASDISVQTDGGARVKETILYDFGAEERHGIFRDIPIRFKDRFGTTERITVSDISVTDERGAAYSFTSETASGILDIRIGDADAFVTGIHSYVISYVARPVVGFFTDHDEIYWNATGNGWKVPIEEVHATVHVPGTVTESACYQGAPGSSQSCVSGADGDAMIFSAHGLNPGDGLTVAVGFPIGIVQKPSVLEIALSILFENLILLLPLVLAAVFGVMWWKIGRDAKGRGTIIAEYDAPPGLSPLAVAHIVEQGIETSHLSAEIVQLAIRGYLTINRVETKTLGIFSSVDYRFDKKKDVDAEMPEEDRRILEGLFKNNRQTVLASDLKKNQDLLKAYTAVARIVDAWAAKEGYYRYTVSSVRTPLIVVAAVLFIGAFFVFNVFESGIGGIVAAIASVCVVGFFIYIMPAKTEKGALAREAILGLKLYLQIAEKNRLDFHNAPEKSPQLFEKLLPYAMVLGVSTAWAKEFDGIYREPPHWYTGASYAAFSPSVFADDMNSFSTATAALATPTSGSGGAGGGGFSGGGFGGGGGGSW